MPAPTEHELQRAFCLYLDGSRDKITKEWRILPALAPGVVYWHTPNGGSRRSGFEGKRLKEIGLKPGIHDLLFLTRSLLFGMEWKRVGESASEAQLEMHRRLIGAGLADSIIVDNLDDAKLFCRNHMLTVNIR